MLNDKMKILNLGYKLTFFGAKRSPSDLRMASRVFSFKESELWGSGFKSQAIQKF